MDSLELLLALRSTPEGRTILTRLFAEQCVKRGRRWLNRYAPPGWWRNCLNGGHSRVHTGYSSEGVLGIAFEYVEEFADDSGYINEGKVLRHFGLWAYPCKSDRLGFTAGTFSWHGPFKKRYPDITVTTTVMDRAWAAFLENPPSELRINFRHPTELDRRFRALTLADRRPRFLDFLRRGARIHA